MRTRWWLAREGVELTGTGGLLTGLLRQVMQTDSEVEMVEHLGYERHALWLGPSGGDAYRAAQTGLVDALIVCCDRLRGLPDSPVFMALAAQRVVVGVWDWVSVFV